MTLKTKKNIHILIIFSCISQVFTSVHFFHPPLLNVEDAYINVQEANRALEIICVGKYPLYWKTPIMRDENRMSINSSINTSEAVNKYKSTITLQDLDYNDTGFYICFYEGTTDLTSADNTTSIYVFINDPVHLFVDNPAIISGHLLIPLLQHRKSIIPCLPTAPDVNVTLWKTESEDDVGEMIMTGTDVTFDPRQGFHLYYPTIYFNGFFQCRAILRDNYQEINLTLFYMPDTFNDPQPFIDTSEAQHPLVNGTFVLKCIVDADPDTRLFIDWDYPNKKSDRINETRPHSHWKTTRGYRHQEVTTYLIVNNALLNDSGVYTCTATDHSYKTGEAKANIVVYATQQPIHVNFTTDMNLSEPVVHQAGQNVKFVITVEAYPTSLSEIYWLKDGQLLQPDNNHYRMETREKTVVLEINHLLRSDAANYTLVGKIKNVVSSICILLEVKDKPVVSLRNGQLLYKIGSQHILECHADGYPVPILWWKWKPCKETKECSSSVSSYSYGWQDVEQNGNFPNRENVSLEHSDVKSFSLVSYLHLTAKQSGHYQCVASNVMGKDNVITPFIVTDADNGFEILLSESKPVDKDTVDLICKVNTYNFSVVEWIWRPMDSNGEIKSLQNIQDVSMSNSTTPYSHSAMIHFQPIHRNMSGEYECIAKGTKNNLTDSKHILIDVKEIQPPVLNKTNLGGGITILIAPGSLQEFYCYSYGVPPPVTSWMKDGQMLDAGGVEMSENSQRLTIKRVLERDAGFYECVVQNRGGTIRANATLDIFTDNRDALHQNALTTGEITALIVFGVVAIILIFVVSCLVKRIMKEKKQKKELGFISHHVFERGYIDIFNPNLPLEDQIDLLPYKHNCEFPKERLKLGKTLGQGAFGRVVQAEAIGLVDGETSTTVAVKMLKDGADMEQRKALIAELKILIHIGKHVNIVNLLGAVTKNIAKGELYVIVEYCCYGNLRHFLLKHKRSYLDQLDHRTGQLDPQISTLPGSPFLSIKDNMANILGMGMDNPTYRQQSLNYADLAHHQVINDSGTGVSVFTSPSGSTTTSDRYLRSSFPPPSSTDDSWNEDPGITTCDLLCFAFQCARGMEYLASRKLIHRDLAARNVLLAKDNVVKICDFGLAKDCYKYSNYIKKTSGLLPIKWMAVESIRDRVFTSKSDTWSFGILLWEIFTLGGNPYPGVEVNEEFFKKLNNGYRMEKPDLAPDKIYQLMKNCWLDDPNQRPDFSSLAEQIGALLESSVRKYYVELNEPYQIRNEELLLNNNDYLQMAGVKMEEYTNMVTEDTPAVIQLESLSPAATDVTYLNMTSANENDEDTDSVFYQWRAKDDIIHYENGHLQVGFQEISTRC